MERTKFDQECRERGVRKRKSTYARCIGDGILQTISISSNRTYVSPKTPYYSKAKRKSNYMSIGLWSMYCPLTEIIFDPEIATGQFKVENF